MFNRVGAFLEAIDKRTEELADAAEEEDRARADAAQQQRQHHSGSSAGAGPSLTSSSYLSPQPPSSGTGTGRSASTAAEFHAVGLVRSHGGTPTPRGGGGPLSSSGRSGSVSAHAGTSAGAGDAAMPHTLGGYAGVHVPLSLPTKLPSFRPGPHDGAEPAHETGSSGNNNGGGAAWRQRPSAGGNGLPFTSLSVPSAVPSDGTAAAAAVERLEARCRALEADKARFQQEAATQRAQCTAARDALWTAEQEARAGRAAQRAAEQALATYKETSQRLLDEAQREVKRVREAAAGSSASASPAAAAAAQAATAEAVHSAQELHQRLELLQADHAALSSEVERCRQEAAKAAAELHRVQEAHRHTQARADALRLDLDAARESLDGEAAAHAETHAALRQLQSQRDELLLHRNQGAAGSSPNRHDTSDAALASSSTAAAATGWSDADVAQLQEEVRELRQRYQMVALQASNRQAALDAAAREAADMKMRYNELAKHVRDAEVEVAAGFNAAAIYGAAAPSPSSMSGFPAPPPSSTAFAGQRAFASGSGAGRAGPSASTTTAATTSDHGAHAGNSGEALRRHPAMVRLGRQYGLAGRALVASVCAIDGTAVQLGRLLTHARWAWRVALMGYIGLLQVWVVLMVIGTLALEESNARAELTGGAGA